MVCIYCASKTKTAVINSRVSAKSASVWRRRRCLHCTGVITTREHVDLENALRIQKNNSLEPFQRDRLFMSVYDSVSHRKTALSDATQLTDNIVNSLLNLQAGGVLGRQQIVDTTAVTLGRFDSAAGTRYSALHR